MAPPRSAKTSGFCAAAAAAQSIKLTKRTVLMRRWSPGAADSFSILGPAGDALPGSPLAPGRTVFLSVKRAGEGAAAQIVEGVRLLVDEVGDRQGDLVVDVAVLLLVKLGEDADLGDEKVGVGDAVRVHVLRQPGPVLDGEPAERGAARK